MSDHDKAPVTDMAGGSAVRGRMLPGVAAIALLLIFVTVAVVLRESKNGSGNDKHGVLALCSIMAVGLLGLLRMRRWGHAIVVAGCLLGSAFYFYIAAHIHQEHFMVPGLFMLLFFLYLVRPEVRDRMI